MLALPPVERSAVLLNQGQTRGRDIDPEVVSRRRARQLREADVPQDPDPIGVRLAAWGVLPDPEAIVSGQPAWRWSTIEQWARETGRLR